MTKDVAVWAPFTMKFKVAATPEREVLGMACRVFAFPQDMPADWISKGFDELGTRV